MPRSRATRRAVVRRFSPSIVARTMLCGFVEPRLFVSMSRMPAHSSTARTGPPAITPVPDAAGLSSTRPAPCFPMISCGIVPPVSGTSDMRRRAASTALRTASLTSLALPVAIPTWPLPSPTATSALKLKRRPPFTTFATRLIATTFSTMPSPSRWRSPPSRRPPGRWSARRFPQSRVRFRLLDLASEHQSPFASAIGDGFHTSVILVAAAIEHDFRDPFFFRFRRDEPAERETARDLALALDLDAFGRIGSAGERDVALIVDELRVDVLRGAEHDEARPLGRPCHFLANAEVPAIPVVGRCFDLVNRSHDYFAAWAVLPALRRTCSPT